MIAIIGESAAGKTSVIDYLDKYSKTLCGKQYNKVITCTTRPKREGEFNGVDYNFMNIEDFEILQNKGEFLETAIYSDNWHYGTLKKDINDNSIIALTPKGLRALKKYIVDNIYDISNGYSNEFDLKSFYIKVDRRSRLKKLIDTRENIDESIRRNISDVGMFDGVESEVDHVINNQNYIKCPALVASEILTDIKNDKMKDLCHEFDDLDYSCKSALNGKFYEL